MSSFTSPLVVSPQENGHDWKLYRAFTYHVGSRYSKDIVRVPAKFVTDFASIPSQMWWWLPPFGKYTKAAVLHDWLYHTKERTRKEADAIFLETMLCCSTPKWKAYPMYWAVRAFGFIAWGLH